MNVRCMQNLVVLHRARRANKCNGFLSVPLALAALLAPAHTISDCYHAKVVLLEILFPPTPGELPTLDRVYVER